MRSSDYYLYIIEFEKLLLKKDQSYSNQDIKDDWDNADNDW